MQKEVNEYTFNSDVFTEQMKKDVDFLWKLNKAHCISVQGQGAKEFEDYVKEKYSNAKTIIIRRFGKDRTFYRLEEIESEEN